MARQKSLPNVLGIGDIASRTLILDNGAHTLKAGFSSHASTSSTEPNSASDCYAIPNCIARSARDKRTYIGPELEECDDFAELAYRRPVEKGCIVNWEGEKAIWERSFLGNAKHEALRCEPEETNLVMTEPPNAPAPLQRNADEMVFEEFGFRSYYRCIAPVLNAYAPSPFPSTAASPSGVPLECLLLVDAGHSHTTVTPLYQGRPFQSAIRRLEVGGKTLTNQLKELISRTLDVHKEDHIVNEIKEDVCYVSRCFNEDLEKTWKGGRYDARIIDPSIVVDYVLPDYETIKRGFPRPHDSSLSLRSRAIGVEGQGGRREHVLTIGNERFVVPELLFSPGDIGMQQEGIAGTIIQSIDVLPAGLKQAYLANIAAVGGTSKLPGFVERLETEIRQMVDTDLVVRVARVADPIKNAWLGGGRMARSEEAIRKVLVTREEYAENGEGWVRRKFAGKAGR
ncbi:hypothetical protein BAUCODRAFT_142604 [Baudoinia panamericana UAMH 10762]|uniref:Actin-like protein ARP6 n=1 Tax=Baudoinia panamericana (strain UAMH 10762) TaxID=717646 RepID=M2N296_BAUPA|nr:uncharacterized protein BAUCODRAFT_142604 [Baudoinia panamericana UAMH 10762]EMC93104.1 hypothetical protein BAUCODRAFT_142604 [Baudoinia panamericana UAMH 10762]